MTESLWLEFKRIIQRLASRTRQTDRERERKRRRQTDSRRREKVIVEE